jgi:hypothetical protein
VRLVPNSEVENPSWPHPVVAGGRLYLREQDRLYAFDVREPGRGGGADGTERD